MRLDWDDPFGKRAKAASFRQASGLFVPQETIDIDSIREAQRKLCSHFEALAEAADELLDEADNLSRMISARTIFSIVTYRLPDRPQLVNSLPMETSGHIVVLLDFYERLHPLVDRLFPAKDYAAMTPDERKAVHDALAIKQAKPKLESHELPRSLRVVFPEMVRQIMHWIENIEGPIKDVSFCARPPEKFGIVHKAYVN